MSRRVIFCIAGSLLLLPLAACSNQSEDEIEAEPTTAVDPRIAALASVANIKAAQDQCEGVSASYVGKDADLTRACVNKLSELISRDEIPDFETGLRFLKRQLVDGKIKSIEGMAAQSALTAWLRQNAPKAPDAALFRWRSQLPSEDADSTFVFTMMRSTINEALSS